MLEPQTIQNPQLESLKKIPLSVLLIDDQLIIAEAVRRMLENEPDVAFHYCREPSRAIEMAAEVLPTVILQDLVMPDIDGLMLVRYFRANPATREVPLIVLSTKEDPRTKAEAFALGANDYMVKLPDKEELIARIRYHSESYTRLLQRNMAFEKLEESQKALNAELAEAADYVRSLLPPPQTNHVSADWRFIPSTQLGGDAFGYHWIDSQNFGIYLLDVCGHGVGAALLSITVMNVLRAQSLPNTNFCDPVSVLASLNGAFQMEKQNNMFFTIWYGVYNKPTRTLTYSSGGHPPAILFTGPSIDNMDQVELKTPGLVIGAHLEAKFTSACCQIGPYNRLYVFSDGVYEIRKPNDTIMRLQEFIEILRHFAKQETSRLDHVLSTVQDIAGNTLFVDDFSLVEITFS